MNGAVIYTQQSSVQHWHFISISSETSITMQDNVQCALCFSQCVRELQTLTYMKLVRKRRALSYIRHCVHVL